ncbi:MAG: YbaK/EbsC family protein [Actinomycetota bacterium]
MAEGTAKESPHLARVREAAAGLGVDLDVHRFRAGTRTAADAAEAIGCELGAICKSIVMLADGEPILVLTSGANRVDAGAVAEVLGANEVRMAGAQECREATGSPIGGTAPFGHPRPLRMLLDRDLLAFEEVWAAAGLPDAVFPIASTDLHRLTGARVADVAA